MAKENIGGDAEGWGYPLHHVFQKGVWKNDVVRNADEVRGENDVYVD